jgi:V8-like Glu-specific endopeptidase
MKSYPKFASALVAAASLCLGQPWAFAQAETSTRHASEDGSSYSQGAEYWTQERAEEAEPVPWYSLEEDPEALPFSEEEFGPPEAVPGGGPRQFRRSRLEPRPGTPEGGEAADAEESFADGSGSDFDADFGTADTGDNDYVNQNTTLWKLYPWRTIGKLLITTSSGGSGYCTASVISPNSVIVTAAHCCYDRGTKTWNRNFAFVPAMRSSTRPYGTFPYSSATVLSAWISSGGRQNDVCVLKLNNNELGQAVSSTVGWLGRSWNQATIQHHFAFGYPSNISSGSYKYECSAESYASCGNSSIYGMGCNMTFGSSGGPWVRVFKKYTSGAMDYVNSVVSGHDACTGTFGQSFNGARFTSSNIVPLCTTAGC